ncbi:hypothetical protein [Pseudomaricurvus alcaniphilus]|uniref:hypothetical protein n=1 Tax=Pseudomaricurvus alcaniphilus TaxID=1166482 RepID=UPI002441F919|nr:hypothetical protein [Pseudomaricurvus alcaniphilus]
MDGFPFTAALPAGALPLGELDLVALALGLLALVEFAASPLAAPVLPDAWLRPPAGLGLLGELEKGLPADFSAPESLRNKLPIKVRLIYKLFKFKPV